MAQLIAVENISLDGVMQGPGRADEDTRGGFERGGWASEALTADPEAAQASMAGSESTVAMLFGHRTYDDLVGHWLATTEPNPFTEILIATPKYVVSRDAATQLSHPNSHLLAGDAVDTVAALKSRIEGDIVILGSGAMVRDLAAAGLIDRYVITLIPVLLGSGARLFDGTSAPLTVESTLVFPTGIVVARYAMRGH